MLICCWVRLPLAAINMASCWMDIAPLTESCMFPAAAAGAAAGGAAIIIIGGAAIGIIAGAGAIDIMAIGAAAGAAGIGTAGAVGIIVGTIGIMGAAAIGIVIVISAAAGIENGRMIGSGMRMVSNMNPNRVRCLTSAVAIPGAQGPGGWHGAGAGGWAGAAGAAAGWQGAAAAGCLHGAALATAGGISTTIFCRGARTTISSGASASTFGAGQGAERTTSSWGQGSAKGQQSITRRFSPLVQPASATRTGKAIRSDFIPPPRGVDGPSAPPTTMRPVWAARYIIIGWRRR
jgi:hypothetical protein